MGPKDASGVGRTDQIFVCSDYCKAKCRTSETERRKTYYDVTEDEFAAYMEQIVRMGACVIEAAVERRRNISVPCVKDVKTQNLFR